MPVIDTLLGRLDADICFDTSTVSSSLTTDSHAVQRVLVLRDAMLRHLRQHPQVVARAHRDGWKVAVLSFSMSGADRIGDLDELDDVEPAVGASVFGNTSRPLSQPLSNHRLSDTRSCSPFFSSRRRRSYFPHRPISPMAARSSLAAGNKNLLDRLPRDRRKSISTVAENKLCRCWRVADG